MFVDVTKPLLRRATPLFVMDGSDTCILVCVKDVWIGPLAWVGSVDGTNLQISTGWSRHFLGAESCTVIFFIVHQCTILVHALVD